MTTLALLLVILAIGIWIGILIGFSKAVREAANRYFQKNKPIGAWAFVVGGFVCLCIALGFLVHSAVFVRTAMRAQGRVVELRAHHDKNNEVTYSPVVSFRDMRGSEHLVESHFSSFPADHQVGESLPVLYRSEDPENAKVDVFMEIWGGAIIAGALGLIFGAAGLVNLFWRRPRETPASEKCPAGGSSSG